MATVIGCETDPVAMTAADLVVVTVVPVVVGCVAIDDVNVVVVTVAVKVVVIALAGMETVAVAAFGNPRSSGLNWTVTLRLSCGAA